MFPAEVRRFLVKGKCWGYQLIHPRPFRPAQVLEIWVADTPADLPRLEAEASAYCKLFNRLKSDENTRKQEVKLVPPVRAKPLGSGGLFLIHGGRR